MGIPLLLAAVWVGGVWFLILVLAVASLASREFSRIAAATGARPLAYPAAALAPALALAAFFGQGYLLSALAAIPPLILALLLLRRDVAASLRDFAYTVGGVLYLGLPLALAVLLRSDPSFEPYGQEWVLLAVLLPFATDTTAYFTGRSVGRHPLAPSISPGKTWEGAVGGLVGALVASALLSLLLDLAITTWGAVILGGLIGVVAQVGDLAESMLKRGAGAKEAGGIIPGHGGLLDRLDSVAFSLVVVYYFAVWVV